MAMGVFLTMVAVLLSPALALSSSDKRVALVTGANKGIVKEIARKLVDANIQTIVACRTGGEATANELKGSQHVNLDLTDDSSIEACQEFVKEKYGRLDILINNAAICFNDPTLYGKVEYTPFERQAGITVRTNYFGTRKVTDSLLPLLQKSPSPRIINIASSAGRLGILRSQEKVEMFTNPELKISELDGYMNSFIEAAENGEHEQWAGTCYGMSKLGIIALTKVMSRQNENLRVNSVDPGYCATDQNNNQGIRPAERGAVTPFLLATTNEKYSGLHWFDEQVINW